jgi:hypothetical protein
MIVDPYNFQSPEFYKIDIIGHKNNNNNKNDNPLQII